jgi:hypothetical protein
MFRSRSSGFATVSSALPFGKKFLADLKTFLNCPKTSYVQDDKTTRRLLFGYTTIELSHFLFRFFRNHESYHHHGFWYLFFFAKSQPLINPMRDSGEKALEQGAIPQITF